MIAGTLLKQRHGEGGVFMARTAIQKKVTPVKEKVALVFSLKLNCRLNGKQLAAIFAAATTTIATLVINLLSQH
jgi:hypothetical protein